MHPELERLRKQVDWKAKAKALCQPRFIVLAVDNVAYGYSEIPGYLKGVIEGYFTTYVVDTWECTHLCEAAKSAYLLEVGNTLWVAEGTPEDVRDKLEQEWCYYCDDSSTYVHWDDIENGRYGVIVDTIDGDEDMTLEDAREAEQGNPSL